MIIQGKKITLEDIALIREMISVYEAGEKVSNFLIIFRKFRSFSG